ncbi:hypothetical protein V2J09_023792 [Rumex salicifolius]
MSSELGDRRFVKGGSVGGVGGVGPEPENVQCPRCESTNTKFCYYNNYNLSQPRYFCKACRRYWTRGGTLRNIPVGGGSRKNSKRSRPTTSHSLPQPPPQLHLTPLPVSFVTPNEPNLNESLPPAGFSSLLTPQSRLQQQSPFLGLGGYGLGSDFDGLAFGTANDGVMDVSSIHQDQEPQSECNTWQVGETDGGDCFGWPELAMSTPGTARLERSFWPAN